MASQTNPLDELLESSGWKETYGIGLYANPEYGSIVVDLNGWDCHDPESSAQIIPSINSSSDSWIGFINSYDELDKTILEYIDRYKVILTKEEVAGFGPKFGDQVVKACFLNAAELEASFESHNESCGPKC